MSVLVAAQQPTADQLRERVRASVDKSAAALPDIFCDEQVTSSQMRHGNIHQKIVLDSDFTATRAAGTLNGFKEHRTLRTVNGRPARPGKIYKLPLQMANGVGTVYRPYLSPNFAACNIYSVITTTEGGHPAFELDVQQRDDSASLPACQSLKIRPGSIGSFWIAADTDRLLRFSFVAPHDAYAYHHGDAKTTASITFAAIQFGPTFSVLPVTITAAATNAETGDTALYRADYSNCHRFVSTITLLPDAPEPMP